MDFSLTSEQLMFQKMFRDFATKEVAKVAEQADKQEEIPAKLLKRAAGQGFMGALAPEPYGGAGLDVTSFLMLLEALAAESLALALVVHVHNSLALRTILNHGTAAAKEALIPEMAAGERIGAFAMTEAGAGSDPTQMRTRAVREGGEYVLNGAKAWVSNGGIAGVFVVFAVTVGAGLDSSPDAAQSTKPNPPLRMSAFAIPADAPGLVVGGREKTLGLRGASITRLYLQECRVPAENLLGAEGAGYPIALEALDFGRVGISAAAVGLARRAVELAVKYSGERVQFGKPIGAKQAIQVYLADCATEVAAAEGLVRHAAWLAEQGKPFTQEAAMAKLFAGRMAATVTNKIVQVHGGAGYVTEYPIERFYRDARALEFVEGASQIQQIVIAGKLFEGSSVKVRP
ncbi:MAG: acyl-CoA dehydrogenase family protein [Chloroflexi bacterium]|nr:acyl-CoA dehydrogenase family protein [Chloroflexota bacterium]